ncbi:hypothetical protein XF_2250 [Xylella fastidiosa 9a5c]|uniref:Uncharacterized protein n=1 Tax=Xylella fastidiosa (strain 9a5c) TaxID=160492 RepID=Q9PB94_XYLFA|nr:hypothetical protein XF_2250 [Xylella fastidiosa 9a5c]
MFIEKCRLHSNTAKLNDQSTLINIQTSNTPSICHNNAPLILQIQPPTTRINRHRLLTQTIRTEECRTSEPEVADTPIP